MINSNLPPNSESVMVTYKKSFSTGPYGDTKELREVTKMGFYSELFQNFAIPPEWRMFNGILLPHGWGGDYLAADEIIKWEPIND